jgi:Na+/H+-translocating membrane pyrophosphatase
VVVAVVVVVIVVVVVVVVLVEFALTTLLTSVTVIELFLSSLVDAIGMMCSSSVSYRSADACVECVECELFCGDFCI